jgi:hypothetical protein
MRARETGLQNAYKKITKIFSNHLVHLKMCLVNRGHPVASMIGVPTAEKMGEAVGRPRHRRHFRV